MCVSPSCLCRISRISSSPENRCLLVKLRKVSRDVISRQEDLEIDFSVYAEEWTYAFEVPSHMAPKAGVRGHQLTPD